MTCLGSLSLAQLLQGPLQLLLSDLQLLVCLCLDGSRLLHLMLGHLQLLLGFKVPLLELLQLGLQRLSLSNGGLAVLQGRRQLVACCLGLQPANSTLFLPHQMLEALAPQDANGLSPGRHR